VAYITHFSFLVVQLLNNLAERKDCCFKKHCGGRRSEHRNLRVLKYPRFLGQQSFPRGDLIHL